jgi:uncharacterized protein
MARPIKCRRVDFFPGADYFKPAGIPLRDLEEVHISFEEMEAIRLKDVEGLEQEQGADQMNVSRPTFQRILASARRKIADAILHGKALRIEGGNYEMAQHRFSCLNGHEWEVPFTRERLELPLKCPTCAAREIFPILPQRRNCAHPGRGRCCQKTHHPDQDYQAAGQTG